MTTRQPFIETDANYGAVDLLFDRECRNMQHHALQTVPRFARNMFGTLFKLILCELLCRSWTHDRFHTLPGVSSPASTSWSFVTPGAAL